MNREDDDKKAKYDKLLDEDHSGDNLGVKGEVKSESDKNNDKIDVKNQAEDVKKEEGPQETLYWYRTEGDSFLNANFVSRLFFYWAYEIIKLANKVTLKPEYLGPVEGTNKSANVLNNLHDIWYRKKYKDKKRCALMCTILRSNLCRIISMIIMTILIFALEFAGVYSIKAIINYFNGNGIKDIPLYVLGILFLSFKIVSIFLSRQNQFYQSIIGYKSSIELNLFILDKVFKASPSSFSTRASEGDIINHIQVDSQKLGWAIQLSPSFLIAPIQIFVYLYWLFDFFGVSFAFGLGTMIFFMIINLFVQRKLQNYFVKILGAKDARMKITSETFNCLKILKLYSWENEFLKKLLDSRDKEMSVSAEMLSLMSWNIFFMYCAPIAISVASIGAYQSFVKTLDISSMLMALTLFNMLQEPIRNIPYSLNSIYEVYISMGRIEKFINQDEIKYEVLESDASLTDTAIRLQNCNWTWGSEAKSDAEKEKEEEDKAKKKEDLSKSVLSMKTQNEDTVNKNDASMISNEDARTSITDSNNNEQSIKIHLQNINLEVKKGEMIGVIGEVGSGKSTLLQAILNNLILLDKEKNNSRLVINGSVSYVSQTPWIQNETLRNNITFFEEFNKEKYENVLNLCCLKSDIEMLTGGDMTEIGEKGINLSGGQKARVALARAVHSDTDIYLLDDPISALDAHVGELVMKECILTRLNKKTRVLVTNAIHFLKYMDRIVYMKNGKIEFTGTFDELEQQPFWQDYNKKLESDELGLLRKVSSDGGNENAASAPEAQDEELIDKKETKKEEEVKRITDEEDRESGFVGFNVYLQYFVYNGGVVLSSIVLLCALVWQALKAGSDFWLAIWTKNQKEEDNNWYFLIYSGLALVSTVFVYVRIKLMTVGNISCGKRLHSEMVTSLVNAPINLFHDKTPKGRIYNRLSKDIEQVTISFYYYGFCITSLFNFIGSLVICSMNNIYSLTIMPVMLILGFLIVRYYLSASRDLTRMEGIARSPILNTLNEVLPGTMIIRGYKYEDKFVKKYTDRIDELFKVQLFTNGTYNWFGISMDFVAYSFLVFLIVFAIVFESTFSAQSIGLLLTYALALQSSLFYFLSMCGFFANFMVSMERCLSFTNIESEKHLELPDVDNKLGDWPRDGRIEFKNYSVKYRPDTPLVLKNLNFDIPSNTKVGIVGRTGSGKSTICLSVFRMIEPFEGTIFIDGVDITKIGLRALRKKLTIIPQDPSLVKGTLRYNIDPLELSTDEEIREVMTSIGFWYLAEKNDKGLDMEIVENGDNVSVGEKQLICITRAILRKSKIVVMDEATANIDVKTEKQIQAAINTLFKHSTIITIAHRIKTILDYDRIIVLKDGQLMEYDTPDNLRKDKTSMFYDLYKKSKH